MDKAGLIYSITDKDSINSLTKAIQSFDDAFLALKAVEKSEYKIADEITPHHKDYRVGGYPKDSFHVACGSHITRIKNILQTPGNISTALSRVDQPNQHAVAQVKFTVCQKWRSCFSKSSGRRHRPIEKSLLKQRLANLPTAQNGYIEKQRKNTVK